MKFYSRESVIDADETNKPKYTKEEIKTILHTGVANVEFTKVDGTVRNLICTLQEDYIKPQNTTTNLIVTQENKRPDNPGIVAVWDVENNGWRSFRVNSVISIT